MPLRAVQQQETAGKLPMKNDFNLRRRTRDLSWQWLMMGVVLGLGFALVVCVGGYALDAVKFPALEEETPSKTDAGGEEVQVAVIEPNSTDVALQATASLLAITQQAASITPTLTAESPAVTEEPAAQITPQPSPLPGSTGTPAQDQAVSGQQDSANTFSAGQNTPVVGTPPVGAPTQTLTFANEPAVPAELDPIKTDMVTVTGGSFLMGTNMEEATAAMDECALYNTTCPYSWVEDSTPEHQVTVDSFEMDIYEVSLLQYVTFLNWLGPNSHKNGCQGQPCALTDTEQQNSYITFDGTTYSVKNSALYNDHPVTHVTWWGAEAYCEALNRRLPTEAEWERAARGPQDYIYPWGNTFDVTLANSSRPAAEGTEPVNSYLAGASTFGILNMAGNVEEWVSDWYQSNYYQQLVNNPGQPNPQGPISGTQKVLRGGSWDAVPPILRSVHRRSWDPGNPQASMGFRCVKDIRGASNQSAAPADTNSGTGANNNSNTAPSGQPTMPSVPTPIRPTFTPAGPTATINPG